VTFVDLSAALKSRDEDLKSLIKSNFDAIMAVLNSKQDSGPHTVRRNLSTTGAFASPSVGVCTGATSDASPSGGMEIRLVLLIFVIMLLMFLVLFLPSSLIANAMEVVMIVAMLFRLVVPVRPSRNPLWPLIRTIGVLSRATPH
jgi:hypothetical protein